MRRPLIAALIALGLLTGLVAAGTAYAATGNATPAPKTITITGTRCPGGAEFCFTPASVVITHGTKVVWKNLSIAPHTVNRCTTAACHTSPGTGVAKTFGSKVINPKGTYTFTFTKTGTYRYYCKVHGYSIMHGLITVH